MSRGRKPCAWDNPRGARATHTQTTKTHTLFSPHARRTDAGTLVLCLSRATVGRSLSEGQRSQRRLYTGARNSHWCHQQSSRLVGARQPGRQFWAFPLCLLAARGTCELAHHLPANIRPVQSRAYTENPISPHRPINTHTHACTAIRVRSPCQMPNVRAFFPIFFHVFPYYSRPWIIITLVVNLFNSTCLARPSSTRH